MSDMNNRIQLLDCTLRDGGFEFEDAARFGMSDKSFTNETIGQLASYLTQAGVDIIELGLIEQSDQDRRQFAIYQDVESVSMTIPSKQTSYRMYSAMFRGPDTPIERIPPWSPSYCEVLRVILRYSELRKSLDFCGALVEKGYKVFMQPSVTARYSDSELQLLIDAANEMRAYALYFVDTYGYMQEGDVLRFLRRFDNGLDPSVRIGYHAHNNMAQAVSNANAFLSYPTKRRIILDSCLLGFGQGAGNLHTEIIANYLNQNCGKNYDYRFILDACEIMEQYTGKNISGYSVPCFLSARHKAAYRYSMALREGYHLSFREIDAVLSRMPEDFRHRYTPECVADLLRQCEYCNVEESNEGI